jgi:hypothetical protein
LERRVEEDDWSRKVLTAVVYDTGGGLEGEAAVRICGKGLRAIGVEGVCGEPCWIELPPEEEGICNTLCC